MISHSPFSVGPSQQTKPELRHKLDVSTSGLESQTPADTLKLRMSLQGVTCKAGRIDNDPFHREPGTVNSVFLQEQPDLFGVVS